jgi:Leucine-rich repeat (LRR) protein
MNEIEIEFFCFFIASIYFFSVFLNRQTEYGDWHTAFLTLFFFVYILLIQRLDFIFNLLKKWVTIKIKFDSSFIPKRKMHLTRNVLKEKNLLNSKIIDLTDSNIRTVDPGTFHGLTNLKMIYLNTNQIISLDKYTFHGLTNLDTIFLHSNQIRTIDQNIFQGLKNLQWIYLSYNEITSIHPNTFYGLTNLERINLSCNKISSIDQFTFEGLKNLKEINLSCNQISYVDVKTFINLKNLTMINLDENFFSNHNINELFEKLPKTVSISFDNQKKLL